MERLTLHRFAMLLLVNGTLAALTVAAIMGALVLVLRLIFS